MGWGHPRHHEASQGRRDVCKSTLETITMRVIIAASPTAVSQEPAATSCQGMALVIALVTDLPTADTARRCPLLRGEEAARSGAGLSPFGPQLSLESTLRRLLGAGGESDGGGACFQSCHMCGCPRGRGGWSPASALLTKPCVLCRTVTSERKREGRLKAPGHRPICLDKAPSANLSLPKEGVSVCMRVCVGSVWAPISSRQPCPNSRCHTGQQRHSQAGSGPCTS